ncbi:hypothetical protein HYQ45_000701 [Verticillium longisporum]|uniref:Uncharacterized protein n=1 Tax=Verticillium longisporum TaxID=100787 RepID=A0A8I3AWU7_VERLO|nr:hypothetical protein HYQ45_000701 [Verticillium longisporum]
MARPDVATTYAAEYTTSSYKARSTERPSIVRLEGIFSSYYRQQNAIAIYQSEVSRVVCSVRHSRNDL